MGGINFTWIGIGGIKLSKLDRFLVSPALLNEWPAVSVIALNRIFVDHCPLLLKSAVNDYGPSPLRFFDHSMQDEGFNEMVKTVRTNLDLSGNPLVVLKQKLKHLKGAIKSWKASHP